jgi:hypothetical protein
MLKHHSSTCRHHAVPLLEGMMPRHGRRCRPHPIEQGGHVISRLGIPHIAAMSYTNTFFGCANSRDE